MKPGPLTDICLDCRTALGSGEPCDGGKRHRTVPLGTQEGREALLREVWGPPSLRQKLKKAALVGSGGGAATGAVLERGCDMGCGAVVGGMAEIPIVAILIGIILVFVLLYLLVAKIVEVIRRRQNRPRPNGALRPPLPPRGGRHKGRVAPDAPTLESLAGEAAVARGLRLSCKRFIGSDRMLIDGACGAFNIRLGDGALVRIPAGRVRLEGPKERYHALRESQIQAFLQKLDPLREQGENADDLDTFPYDRASEIILWPGEEVELLGRIEPAVDTELAPGSSPFRKAAPSVLVPRGPVMLRLERER